MAFLVDALGCVRSIEAGIGSTRDGSCAYDIEVGECCAIVPELSFCFSSVEVHFAETRDDRRVQVAILTLTGALRDVEHRVGSVELDV